MIKEKANLLLTIIIPTYNRCQILDINLKQMKLLSDKYQFNLVVCNNASTDKTTAIINKWKLQIPHMEVVNHQHNIYFDRNVASGYKQVKTDYCWVLGDSYTVDERNFDSILTFLEQKRPHAIIINTKRNNILFDDKSYEDSNTLLRELGWYTTLLPSCIVRKEFLETMRFERYYDTGFVHEGMFFDYLSSLPNIDVQLCSSVYFEEIKVVSRATSSWRKIPFKVFGLRWFAFVMSLPYNYDIKNKLYCIKQHDKNKKVFSTHRLLFLKIIGCTKFNDYREARPIMKYVSSTPRLAFDIISYIPSMPKFFKYLFEKLYKLKIIKKKWVEMVNNQNY